MHKATINIPERLDLATVLHFARTLDDFAMHDLLNIDFQKVGFFAPFTMLFIAAKLKSFRQGNPDLKITFKNFESHRYAGHMGFFRMFDFNIGRDVGEAFGSGSYLPITRVQRETFYETEVDRFQEIQDLIQRHADKLSLILARDAVENQVMYDTLAFCIREIMRNVFEHSRTSELYYCAQHWPVSNKVEIAIADFGIGIRRGLSENPNFAFNSDKEAIEYSLLPSVSGKTHLPRRSDNWFNSGYGLYMTNRLARNGGNFVIASRTAAVHLSRMNKNNFITSFPGTIIRMNIDIKQIINLQDRLQEFRKDAHEIAKNLKGTGNRPASAMSLLIRRDFSK